MAVHVVDHPLVRHKLGLLRREALDTKSFREIASEVAMLLTYEATQDLETERVVVEGWAGPVEVEQIRGKKITVVPILRAGLGMMDGVLSLLPSARVSVVGMYRDESTLQPVRYYAKIASDVAERTALILDPMLATGGTLVATIDLLKSAGCRSVRGIFLVAAPEGLQKLQASHPDVEVFVAAVDEGLNDAGYILPGLGDAGDRIFGTR